MVEMTAEMAFEEGRRRGYSQMREVVEEALDRHQELPDFEAWSRWMLEAMSELDGAC